MSDTDARHDRLLRLNAALDDELDAAHRIELERELERDPQLRASLRRLSVVREAVRRHGATEAAPAALRNAVAGIGRPKADWRRAPLPLAAAVALGIGVGAAAQALLSASRAPDPVTASLVADFARAGLSERPFDVASSDRHTVKPWLVAHAPLGVEIADLADKGYPLAGGRLAVPILPSPPAREAMAINGHRNKSFGPGGSTRRLHPSPLPLKRVSAGAK